MPRAPGAWRLEAGDERLRRRLFRNARAGADLLLVGVSTRALAASVRRSGFRGRLLALDLFADLDQQALCPCLAPGWNLRGARGTAALLRVAARLRPRRVMFSGGMETHPRLLAVLERQAPILGNGAPAVRAVRDPARFFGFLGAAGLPHPRTWIGGSAERAWHPEARRLARAGRLLWKPRHGGGGLRIRIARTSRARAGYFQERVHGIPGSVAFIGDGRRCRVLGCSRVLCGEAGLGAAGFAYCGNLWGPPEEWIPAPARGILARAAALLTARFGLRGLNGIDFVLARDVPLLLEVNPRYTSSMELIEEGWGRSLFALHREACLRGRLPGPGVVPEGGVRAQGWIGKGILYAPRFFMTWDLSSFLEARARDIPRPGSSAGAGAPLCTLVARAASAGACRRLLLERGARLRRALFAAARARRAS